MTKDVELGPFKMVGPKNRQSKEYIEPRFSVTIGTLGAEDSMIADDYVGASVNQAKAQKIYAICSIKKLNGKQVHPLQDVDQFKRLLDKFDGPAGLIRVQILVREFFLFANEQSGMNDPKDSADEPPSAE